MMNNSVSRREFLKQAGVGAAALTTATFLPLKARPVAASEVSGHPAWGVLIDLTRCTGCEACVLACKKVNNLPNPDTSAVKLESSAYSCLETRLVNTEDSAAKTTYVKRQCMHCLHPACASACTVGALTKSASGPVVYDSNKCIGCRYCQYACPFSVPTFDWANPLGLIHKCQFCKTRLSAGERPACGDACPNGAIRFGPRDNLLAQAHAQIESNPGRYVRHVYGEFEAGGTSMLYLSAVPFSKLGFPTLGSEPIPEQAEAVMRQTPIVALTVASLASALAWFLKMREHKLEIAHEPAEAGEAANQ
jgi:formate dehydrogenase iron-sulfur subunit